MIRLTAFLFTLFFLQTGITQEIELSPLFSDHMVIQRDQDFFVWGTAAPGTHINITFEKTARATRTNKDGKWKMKMELPPVGGPYKMTIEQRTIEDIYIGDVWLAGGQSNMEWRLENSIGAEKEIGKRRSPLIRYFKTPKVMYNREVEELSGGEWQTMNAENTAKMSAVAYFFAKRLYEETEVPIGIIDHSWGGSDIEGWMPHDAFEGHPEWQKLSADFRKRTIDLETEKKLIYDWFNEMDDADLGLQDNWKNLTDLSSWEDAELPGKWEENGYPGLDGIVWYARTFKVDKKGKACLLSLGQIDDSDVSYINGVEVGKMENAYNKDRKYKIDAKLLKAENTIVVRVRDNGGGGGFSSRPEMLYIDCGKQKYELSGKWKMKKGTSDYPSKPASLSVNNLPANRYNAMMIPLFKIKMTGMIWYQGESNVGRANTYSEHFHNMVLDYRKQWDRQFPFLFVQLANYLEEQEAGTSDWAELRDAQASLLDLPKTAMATAIDLGEVDDIHPRNKKDVGERLGLSALNMVYDFELSYKNPSCKSIEQNGPKIIIAFDNDAGLRATKPNDLPGFHIETVDGEFVKVGARLLKNRRVILDVKNLEVKTVYYAWANNPGKLDLYNEDSLPVVPFRKSIKPSKE